jgi:hypothetical protein
LQSQGKYAAKGGQTWAKQQFFLDAAPKQGAETSTNSRWGVL